MNKEALDKFAAQGDETNPSVEKKDHIYTENYIKEVGLAMKIIYDIRQ